MNEKDLKIKKILSLALKYHQENNFKDAGILYKEILKLNPTHVDANNNLGIILMAVGERKKAINCFQKAIEIKPDHSDSYSNLGLIFHQIKEYQKAIQYYEKAIEIEPNHLNAHFNLGLVNQELKNHKKATHYYKKAIKIKSNHSNSYSNIASVFKELGKLKEAIKFYEKAITYEPKNLLNYYYLSELNKKVLTSELKERVIENIKTKKTNSLNLAYGNFLLAKYAQQNKNCKEELDHLLKGHKNYFQSKLQYHNSQVQYWLNKLPNNRELFDLKNKYEKNQKIKPIFIFGTPRCGSTLIEKIIISGNENIPGGEETEIINYFVKQKILDKTSIVSNIKDLKNKIIEKYKEKNLIKKKSNYVFTDKSLDNFFYISLIKNIFPDAKLINCKRDSLSSIISILKNNITGLGWAHSLDNIFEYFNIYNKTMQKYKKIYPNNIYELEIEKFTNAPELESKKLMKFCNLPWSKKCLKFYKRRNLISQTASNIQIRQAIYKHSKEKYLPYKKLLEKYKDKYYWFK